MTAAPDQPNNQPAADPTFAAAVEPLLPDLLYPSESDEPVTVVNCYLNQAEPLTVSQIKDWLMLSPETFVEEVPEERFWSPVAVEQAYFDQVEKARTVRFGQLKQVVETTLTTRQVFRVGEIEIDLYLLGRTAGGERVGLKTKVIET